MVVGGAAPILDLVLRDTAKPNDAEGDRPGPGPTGIAPPDERPPVAPTLLCVNPATGAPLDEIPCATSEDIDRAVEAAAFAHALWRGSPFADRGRLLHRLADLVLDQAESLADLIAEEQGKPRLEALASEILPALDQVRYLAGHAWQAWSSNLVRPRHPLYAHKRVHYLYEALGIVSVVTPYNLPFIVPMVQVAAAVAMGNAVLLKPSERAPLCSIRVGELFQEAGFPQGLVEVLPTTREDALYVVAHPEVEKVFVTGTPETGQRIMATAGCIPRPVVLNLGGKHPAVVAADADLDRAAKGVVWGALANCGQNCGAVERIYVEDAVASKFLDRVVEEVGRLVVGDPMAEDTDIGPLIDEDHRQRVHDQVHEAVEGGAKLVRGGVIPEGLGSFYPPTVLLNPPDSCRLMRLETLGPVLPIVVVESLERAILLANDSNYALTASGWTTSSAVADRLMVGLQAGVVTINDVLYPFGEPAASKCAFKMSGFGPFQGIAGLREMARRKLASVDTLTSQGPVFSFPYDRESASTVRTLLRRFHDRRRGRRISALARLFWNRRFRGRVPLRFFFLKRISAGR